jgi:steroid delta-isomerase-like uncharacterized protein
MKKLYMILPLALILCFMVACQQGEEIAELEEFKAQAEVEEQNKEIVRNIVTAIDEGNPDKFREFMADDFMCYYIGAPEPMDADTSIQIIKSFYEAFPDNTHVIDEIIAEGDTVAVRLTQHATHKGEFEGIPATGNKVIIPAMHFITLVDGKIKEWWLLEENLGLMMQLGMELKPKEGEK